MQTISTLAQKNDQSLEFTDANELVVCLLNCNFREPTEGKVYKTSSYLHVTNLAAHLFCQCFDVIGAGARCAKVLINLLQESVDF